MVPTVHVRETGIDLQPDPARVIARLFVPGREDIGPGDTRASPVVQRILALDEPAVDAAMIDVDARFTKRHADLHGMFRDHAALVSSRIPSDVTLSEARTLLLGASFTHEISTEAAALCNPSIVVHPVQDRPGETALIMSARCIGEGHRSSIGLRTGALAADGTVTVDPPAPHARPGTTADGTHHRSVVHALLAERGDDGENAAQVLDHLPSSFGLEELEGSIENLLADRLIRRNTSVTVSNLNAIARLSYQAEFDPATDISERVLWPSSPAESHGMEDARFVRFVDDDGSVVYYATYTAYEGANISQQLLSTTDFATFDISPMAGPAAAGKGLALFPRKVNGEYVALSRADRETNSVACSTDLRVWPTSRTIQVPDLTWEILQLGNCGSPIETDRGWLALTHGVGPMRTYSIGALLLDLDDPARVVARTTTPILAPGIDQRNGYVPNVVYTCGSVAVGDTLVLPYGVGDRSISIVTLSISALLASMDPVG